MAIQPNADQKETLMTMGKMAIAIFVIWNIPGLNQLIKPFKLLAVTLHEMGHAIMVDLSGGRVVALTINENEGGLTQFSGGSAFLSLPAGYLGSMFWGAVLIYSSFSNYASMVASAAVSAALAYTLLYAQNQLTISVVILGIGLFAVFYFISGSKYLRYYVMFLGTMLAIFSIYDIVDDLINRSITGSDASQFAQIAGGSGREWGSIWLAIGLIMLAIAFAKGIEKYKKPGPITKLLP